MSNGTAMFNHFLVHGWINMLMRLLDMYCPQAIKSMCLQWFGTGEQFKACTHQLQLKNYNTKVSQAVLATNSGMWSSLAIGAVEIESMKPSITTWSFKMQFRGYYRPEIADLQLIIMSRRFEDNTLQSYNGNLSDYPEPCVKPNYKIHSNGCHDKHEERLIPSFGSGWGYGFKSGDAVKLSLNTKDKHISLQVNTLKRMIIFKHIAIGDNICYQMAVAIKALNWEVTLTDFYTIKCD